MTIKIKGKKDDLGKQGLENVESLDDLKVKVLLKTTADLIPGLAYAYRDIESKCNTAEATDKESDKSADSAMFF